MRRQDGGLHRRRAARAKAQALVTSDPYLLELCHAEGIATVPLPASDGSRWTPAHLRGRPSA